MISLIKTKRIHEIDIIRGILVLLMICDHFILIYYNSSVLLNDVKINSSFYLLAGNYLSSSIRLNLRVIVLCIFFILSGICCNFSRNNIKRTEKIGGASLGFSIITYIVSRFTNLVNIFFRRSWTQSLCNA